VGLSDELPRGGLLARPFMGEDLVLYRTASGQVRAIDPYCPHLGAHFGYGGRVEGELLRCPFHAFCYDPNGVCVRTGYGTPPPPKARLRFLPLRERNGLLLVYYDANGNAPAWEVPPIETSGWTSIISREFILFDHPQETTENSVDLGHFAFIHNYRNPRMLRAAQTAGPYLSTAYAVQRAIPILERLFPDRLFEFQFETQIYGLGYSLVNVTVPGVQVEARLWVLPTPIDAERITLRLATSVKQNEPRTVYPLLGVIPRTAYNALVARALLAGFVHDAQQDFVIWQNKRYVNPPALAEGDGPIGKYRQWAKQFYAEPAGEREN
jgi:nitrite reductase/ring-hydroxylating ferredoxin subunit